MKKVITAGLSFAMAASMLAGCSSKPAENSDSGDKRVLKFDSFFILNLIMLFIILSNTNFLSKSLSLHLIMSEYTVSLWGP